MRKFILFCLVFLCGCSLSTKSHLDDIQKNFSSGKYETKSVENIESENNLDLLINGMGFFHENKFKESDLTFEEFNKRNLDSTGSSFIRETSGLLLGKSVNSYKPYMMDNLFVSYYQIWDLLAMNDLQNARVVINQSYNRQQNMSIEYKKLIEENKEKIAQKSEYKKIIDNNISDWLAFSDIMNPALMYLSGIYFLNTGDFENATLYLKRANGMMPENTFIKQDLELAQQRKTPKNIIWEFTDVGFAPRLQEKDASFFLPKIGLVNFAFSEPYFDKTTFKPAKSELLANVDAMFMTEYSQYQINEILRSYTSAVSKAALQATAYNSKSNSSALLGLASTVYTAISSDTEIRTWATLPKNIYIRRLNKSDLNELDIDDSMKEKINLGTNNLIYVRVYNNDVADTKVIKIK